MARSQEADHRHHAVKCSERAPQRMTAQDGLFHRAGCGDGDLGGDAYALAFPSLPLGPINGGDHGGDVGLRTTGAGPQAIACGPECTIWAGQAMHPPHVYIHMYALGCACTDLWIRA